MTVYPGSLDTFTAPQPLTQVQSATITALQQAVAALQVKVGITGSADTTSLDYKSSQVARGGAILRSSASVATMDPAAATSAVVLGSNVFVVTYLTALATFTTTGARFAVMTASSVTGALIGLFSVAANDDITLLTSCTGTQFASPGAQVSTWTTPQSIVAGTRYGIGVIGNGTYALAGQNSWGSNFAAEMGTLPAISALKTGVASVASQTRAAMTNTNTMIYAVLL